YRSGWNLNARDRRAVDARSSYGDDIISRGWPSNEFAMLTRAWQTGASVPYPVLQTEDGFLMEFIGDATSAAPRLAVAGLGPDELRSARDQLLESVRRLVAAQVVH